MGPVRSKDTVARSSVGKRAAAVVIHSLHSELSDRCAQLEALRNEHAEAQIAVAAQTAKLQQDLYETRSAAAVSDGKLAAHMASVQRGSCDLQRALQQAVAEFSSRITAGDVPDSTFNKTPAVNNEAG